MQKTPRHVKSGQQEPRHSAGGCVLSGELSFEIPADAGGGYQWGILSSDKTIRQSGGGPLGGGGRQGGFPVPEPGARQSWGQARTTLMRDMSIAYAWSLGVAKPVFQSWRQHTQVKAMRIIMRRDDTIDRGRGWDWKRQKQRDRGTAQI